MSQENVEIVRSVLEPLDGVNLAAIDWGVEAIREMLGRAYSPDIELTTLASGLGSGVGEFYRGLDGLVRYLHEWMEPFRRAALYPAIFVKHRLRCTTLSWPRRDRAVA
jgi:hypothetical protein